MYFNHISGTQQLPSVLTKCLVCRVMVGRFVTKTLMTGEDAVGISDIRSCPPVWSGGAISDHRSPS
jgi:hypothetical protein